MVIKTLAEVDVVGYSFTVQEMELFVKLPQTYRLFYENCLDINDTYDNKILEVTNRNHGLINKFIGLRVKSKEVSVPKNMALLTIPKGSYLYYLHKGSYNEVLDCFIKMYDYALEEKLSLPINEFKIEIYDDVLKEWHLYLKID